MLSIQRWSTSLPQQVRRVARTTRRNPFSPRISHRSSSSVPQSPNEYLDVGNNQGQRKKSKGWDLEDHLAASVGTEQRVKPRIIEQNDADLIDTHSLVNTLIKHQEANARRTRVRALPTGTGGVYKPDVNDTVVKHLTLEPQQSPEPQEHGGKVFPLAFDWEVLGDVPRYLRLPWMREMDLQKPSRESAMKRLTTEIQALHRFFSPTGEEVKSAQTALEDIRHAILTRCPQFRRVDLIGSRASGLATVLSDLDLNLVPAPTSLSSTKQQPDDQLLTRAWKRLRFNLPPDSPVTLVYYAKMARVPVFAGIHTPTGLDFQIQLATSGYGSMELAKALQAEWPTLQALFIVIKQTLHMRRLNKGQHGGITSYPLLNMIAVSLKYHQMYTDRFDIGTQLLQFFDFWCEIDFYTTGITHHPSKYLWGRLDAYEDGNPLTASNAVSLITQDPIAAVPVKFDARKNLTDLHKGRTDYRMVLHDPANPHNDLGKSASSIKHIQATFIQLRWKLEQDMAEWDRLLQKNGEAEKQPIALLRSLVEGDYTMYNLSRRKLSSSEQERHERSTT